MELGWAEVRARRLARSSLTERAGGDRLVEVAGVVCGVQAQVQAAKTDVEKDRASAQEGLHGEAAALAQEIVRRVLQPAGAGR